MRQLFVRELRRQAPVALAPVVLALLCYGALLVTDFRGYAEVHAAILAALTAPWLLATAAVAPEVESGAVGYLATLPVRPWRLFAVRAAVAGLLATAAAVTAAAAVGLVSDASVLGLAFEVGERGVSADVGLPVGAAAVIVFGAALVTSSALRSTLGAFVGAPVLAGLVVTAATGLAVWSELEAALIALLVGLPLLLLAAAGGACVRGDLHRRSLRPAGLALGVLAAGVLGIHSAVLAVDRVGAGESVAMTRACDGAALVETQPLRRLHDRHRGPSSWRFADARTGTVHDLPAGCEPLSVAPGGDRVLLLRGSGLDLSLWEPAAGVVAVASEQPWPAGFLESSEPVVLGGRARETWLWHAGRPYLLGAEARRRGVLSWDGVESVPLPAWANERVTSAGAWTVWTVRDDDADGEPGALRAWNPATAAARDLALPGGLAPIDAHLLPSGRLLLAAAGAGSPASLWVVDLDAPAGPERLPYDLAVAPGGEDHAWLRDLPGGRFVVVSESWQPAGAGATWQSRAALLDLETAAVEPLGDLSPHPTVRDVAAVGAAGFVRLVDDGHEVAFLPIHDGTWALGATTRRRDGRAESLVLAGPGPAVRQQRLPLDE